MEGNQYVFSRTEKKYLLNRKEYKALMSGSAAHLTEDAYGRYTICNIYFDTERYDLVTRSLEKPVYKEKLRLRAYGVPKENDIVFLEIKKKYDGLVNKRRITMTGREASDLARDGRLPVQDGQIYREIKYFLDFYKPSPKLYLAYDREAYICADRPDIRVTFDSNIRSRQDNLDLSAGDFGDPLFDDPMVIMKVKANSAMPRWLVDLLNENAIYPASFSKYGVIYEKSRLLRNAV